MKTRVFCFLGRLLHTSPNLADLARPVCCAAVPFGICCGPALAAEKAAMAELKGLLPKGKPAEIPARAAKKKRKAK